MKKSFLFIVGLGMLFMACEQKPKKAETVIPDEINSNSIIENDLKNDSEKDTYALDYIYKADNGALVDVTFFEENDKMYIKVKRENHDELVLDQTTAWAKGAEYEKDNYKWTSQNEEATFSDGENSMKLVVISPLQYTYTNEIENITIIYFGKNDKRFVTIRQDNAAERTLEQTTAWAKGAEYGDESMQWHAEGGSGTLTTDGVESKFAHKE